MNQGANLQRDSQDTGANMGLGIGIGLPLGFAIGLLLDSVAIGAALGVGLGVSLGLALSRERREPPKPLTITGAVLVAAAIVVLAIVMHLVEPQWWCDYPVLNLIPGC